MATHDYVIDNSTGANVRADINSVLQAILTNNSSSSAPSTTAAYMFWADTTSGTLKIRNSSDNAWVELFQLDGTLTLEDGSQTAPALAFRDDLNTGIYSDAADTFNIATAGVGRLEIDATEITFNDSGADTDFRVESDTNTHAIFLQASNSRIGINTSSPNEALEVTGNVQVTSGQVYVTGTSPLIKFTDSDASGGFAQVGNNSTSGSLVLRSDDGNALSGSYMGFEVDGSERARITSGGALLLNKTTDRTAYYGGTFSGLLQIEGSGNLSRLTQFIHNQAGQNQHIMVLGKSRGSSTGSYTVVQDDDYLGTLSFQGADGDEMVEGARIDVRVDGTPANSNMPAKMTFGINAGAGSTTERMRIIPTGFVGIGQGSSYDPAAPLEVRNPAGTTPSTGNFVLLRLCAQHNSARGLDIGTGRPTSGNQNDAGVFYNARDTESSTYAAQHIFQRGGSNSMVIGYAGTHHVGIGVTAPTRQLDIFKTGNTVVVGADCDSASAVCYDAKNSISSGTAFFMRFIYTSTVVGSITATNTSTTNFNTSSDYRLKENEVAISDGITRLKKLKPYKFNWKTDKTKIVDGFFAHEAAEAIPEAVLGTKDEIALKDDKDKNIKKGDPIYQVIDHSKFVPLLTAALQEAVSKIEVLETKVAALEAT